MTAPTPTTSTTGATGTTTGRARPPARRARPARPGRAVLAAETRLFLREPFSLFWIAGFPTLLLVVIGLVPSFREPSPDLGGLRVVDAYVQVSVLLSVIMGTQQSMPQVVTAYRQGKVLRRVATTPARPWAVLGAQVALHGAAVVVSAVLVLVVGRLVYDVALPGNLPSYALAGLLALTASLGIGGLVSGVVRSPRTAAVVGSVIYLPSMFSAGVWMPVPSMSGWLLDVVSLTPLGASALALDAAAGGAWGEPRDLLVAGAWAAGLAFVSTRYFRWE